MYRHLHFNPPCYSAKCLLNRFDFYPLMSQIIFSVNFIFNHFLRQYKIFQHSNLWFIRYCKYFKYNNIKKILSVSFISPCCKTIYKHSCILSNFYRSVDIKPTQLIYSTLIKMPRWKTRWNYLTFFFRFTPLQVWPFVRCLIGYAKYMMWIVAWCLHYLLILYKLCFIT